MQGSGRIGGAFRTIHTLYMEKIGDGSGGGIVTAQVKDANYWNMIISC